MVAAALVFAELVRVLTLDDAVRTAVAHQPQLQLAHANTDAARARANEARALLLPQLSGTGSYERTTANFTPRPSFLPASVNAAAMPMPTSQTSNYFNLGLTLNQYLWDFRAPAAWQGSHAAAEAQAAGERSTKQQVLLTVRVAFFAARAERALAAVASDNLTNQRRHLDQVRGFVVEGLRPEIDLAQAETDFANAEVQLITAQNNYDLGRAQLNQAMGVETGTDYEVADDALAPIDDEEQPSDVLFDEAVRVRPDLQSLELQLRAQKLTVSSIKGGFGPSFAASMALTDAGTDLGGLAWNWNVTVTASWTLFDGLLTWSQLQEARANLRGVAAQRDTTRQQVLLDVRQTRLSVRAAKATLAAAKKAVVSARLQLTLAEGRYTEGVGNIIELGDAQLASTTAAAQAVQAEFNLSTARAQLWKALGRN